jgi:dienelactone hydrolase
MFPQPSRTVAARIAKRLDLTFAGLALNPPARLRRKSSAEGLDHASRMFGLRTIAAFYNREALAAPRAFFPKPPAVKPTLARVRTINWGGASGEVLDLSWPSAFTPLWTRGAVESALEAMPAQAREEMGIAPDESVADAMHRIGLDRSGDLVVKYTAAVRNRTAHARWYRHIDGPKPCVAVLHGYMTGTYALEERLWPVRKVFESGLDVAITVLPFHGPRRSEKRGLKPPAFPSGDPRFTIEGFRQLVSDHEALFDYLLEGRVANVGVMGMSLGGYGAALLSTLDARLRFGVFVIPLAAIEDFAHTHGRFIGDPHEQSAQRAALQGAQTQISPMTRPPLIRNDQVIVVAGESDWVTGLHHAQRLSSHFEARTMTFRGGHLLQLGLGRTVGVALDTLRMNGHV